MASLDPQPLRRLDDDRVRRAQERGGYAHVFVLHHPDEEREACRPLRTAPCYDRVKARGAQFGQVNGWERPNYYRPARLRRPRRAQLPPRRLVALRRRGGEGDPRERRPDRRHRLHQARGEGPGRHRLPRLVHHQPPAEGRPAEPHLCADRRRHHAHRVHDLAHGRGRVLPRLRRRLDRLRRRLPAQGRRGPGGRVRPDRDPGRDDPVRRLRRRRTQRPGAARAAGARRRPGDGARQQALPVALGAGASSS